jgi:hypothetical protein
MSEHDQDLIEQHRARLASMTEAEVEAYWMEREEAERAEEERGSTRASASPAGSGSDLAHDALGRVRRGVHIQPNPQPLAG